MRLPFLRSNYVNDWLAPGLTFLVIIFVVYFAGRFIVSELNQVIEQDKEIQLEHYQPGGQTRGKNPVLDSQAISERYLWDRIQPRNLRDTIILTVVLNSDSIWTPDWLLAQAWTESRWQPNVTSSIGCIGILQIHPGTARLIGRNPEKLSNPVYNVETAYIYLRYLTSYHGDRMKVINSYATGNANGSFGWFYSWYVTQQAERLEWLR